MLKRVNKKGFTLVELLAVIVIMGILMLVAIPAISRVIENSRKDTFVDIAKSYANSAKTLWSADTLTCNGMAPSAVDDGDYYILINTKDSAKGFLPVLLDQGGKSSWGNRDVNGYVRVHVETTAGGKRTTSFYVALSDGTHGVVDSGSLKSEDLRRGNITMKLSATDKKKVELIQDDGVLKCVETSNGYVCTEATPPTAVTGICEDGNSLTRTVEAKDPVNFATDDWSTIAVAAREGTYTGKYNVGDTKEVDLGTIGKHTVRIANLSTPAECSNPSFSQTACGFVLEFTEAIVTHNMNPSGEYNGITYEKGWNTDGWKKTSMRSFLNNELYKALPMELQSVIINTNVVSGHGVNDTENSISKDKLYLLSTAEIYAGGKPTYDTAVSSTRQLDYYYHNGVTLTDNLTYVMKVYKGGDAYWWLRTAYPNSERYFAEITGDGALDVGSAKESSGVSPAFRIA